MLNGPTVHRLPPKIFVYSWQRARESKHRLPYASYLQYGHIANIDDIIAGKKPVTDLGVKAIDANTFEVTLSEPCSVLL